MSTELVPTEQNKPTTELATAQNAAMAQREIECAIMVAQKCPRNEDAARQKLLLSVERPRFAKRAFYSYKRGVEDIEGASIGFAREAVRLWGNFRAGTETIADDCDSRTIRAYAWDLETNAKVMQDVTFEKLIQRKATDENGRWIKDPETGKYKNEWVKPDERDLRELSNKNGSIAMRNCITAVLPQDLIDEAMDIAKRVDRKNITEDPLAAYKTVVGAFAKLHITVADLDAYLGHPVRQMTPTEIDELWGYGRAIRDGDMSWADISDKARPTGAEALADSMKTPDHVQDVGKMVETEARQNQTKPDTAAKFLQAQRDIENASTAEEVDSIMDEINEANPFGEPDMEILKNASMLRKSNLKRQQPRGGASND